MLDENQELRQQLGDSTEQCEHWKHKYGHVDLSLPQKYENLSLHLREAENQIETQKRLHVQTQKQMHLDFEQQQ